MPNSQTIANPEFPEVVGFELPGTEQRKIPGQDQIALVMLNTPPSAEWVATFLEQVDAFRSHNRLSDVRVLGSNITLIGRMDDPRGLIASAKLLIETTSQLRMRKRLSEHANRKPPPDRASDGLEPPRAQDVAMVQAISEAQDVLAEVIRLTGMRFAAIARVTDTRWTTCAVYDLLEFGLKPGQDLKLETTICNEIRQQPRTIAFSKASEHPVFAHHHTPALYGFESYISVPIWAADGSFFGTLCALDPKPVLLGAELISAIEQFARGIGQQLPYSPDQTSAPALAR